MLLTSRESYIKKGIFTGEDAFLLSSILCPYKMRYDKISMKK